MFVLCLALLVFYEDVILFRHNGIASVALWHLVATFILTFCRARIVLSRAAVMGGLAVLLSCSLWHVASWQRF